MTIPLARAVSLLGHPVLLLPLAAVAVTLAQGEPRTALWTAAGLALLAALAMGYSWWQVRRGRWAHVDASARNERNALNRFLLPAFAIAALLVAWRGGPAPLALGFAVSAGIILLALLGARWCTLSLHLAFATFAAILLCRLGWAWGLGAVAFVFALAWSRLVLKRHTPRDLVAGTAAGLLAGSVLVSGMFWPWPSWLAH